MQIIGLYRHCTTLLHISSPILDGFWIHVVASSSDSGPGSISYWLCPLCGSGAALSFSGNADGPIELCSPHPYPAGLHPSLPRLGSPSSPSLSSLRGRLSLTAQDNELFCHFSVGSSLLPASLRISCQNYPYPFHHSHSSACPGFHDRYMLENPFGVLGHASHAPDKNKDL